MTSWSGGNPRNWTVPWKRDDGFLAAGALARFLLDRHG